MNDVIPCAKDPELQRRIRDFAEILRQRAHLLQNDLSEEEFYELGIFEGAIQRVRGQVSATLREKKDFVANILNFLSDEGIIADWTEAGGSNRHDYTVSFKDGYVSVIELKGCLDGNNTNISERPPHANEFVVWSVCQNKGADPRHNAWSGIHTRLSADIIEEDKQIDGLVIWDWLCGTKARRCPKLSSARPAVEIGKYKLPPPCIYVFPATIPKPRNNPCPKPQKLKDVRILKVLHDLFGGLDDEVNFVFIEASMSGVDTVRTTSVYRNNVLRKKSQPTKIQRK